MMQSPSQCHDLARRLADLEPGLSDGAARIRAEIEGRRDLAEVREQDRVRTELRDAVTRVAESLEIDGLDATPLDTAVEALTDTVAARIGTLGANANQGTPLAVVSRAVGVWNSRGYRRHQRHHGKYEPSKGYRMTTSEEHRPHEHADHVHGEGCGHEAVQHGDHVDYLHDEHRHAEHEGHYDEHGDA